MLLPAIVLVAMLGAQDVFDTSDPLDDDFQTGPGIGESIPPFRALDADGNSWDFSNLKGPNGALLLFYRSADW